MEQILVSSLMTQGGPTVRRDDTIESVAEIMAANRYSCAVVAAEDEPVGIITERDLVGFLLRTRDEAALLNRGVADLMTAPIKRIRETESLFDALVVSRADKIRHLRGVPVADHPVLHAWSDTPRHVGRGRRRSDLARSLSGLYRILTIEPCNARNHQDRRE